jgi:multidrug resistance efflux pump
MLRTMRPILIVCGLALLIGSILGARALTSDGESLKPTLDIPPPKTGLHVLGTVDTDPPPVSVGLPPVLQSGTIAAVHVKDGDFVAVDQALYEFDATIQKRDVERAEHAVAYAKTKVEEAKELEKQHQLSIEHAAQALKAARGKLELATAYYNFVDKKLEESYKADRHPPDTWPERKKSSLELYKANVDYVIAKNECELAELKLKQLQSVNPRVKVDEAEAAVRQAEAELQKAKSAMELCVVRAKYAGTVERVTIRPGATLGISTRDPAMWIIPAGARVVRAEVEAEFAHRVSEQLKGKEVEIYDHTNPTLTYKGTVRRISDSFLLKRGSAENFLGGDTRVIEVVIEVTDPAPKDRPPLRVGQRVRVNLGT